MDASLHNFIHEAREEALAAELGLEGFSTITDFLAGAASRILKRNDGILIDKNGYGFLLSPIVGVLSNYMTRNKLARINKIGYEPLEKILVLKPSGFKGNISEYTDNLLQVLVSYGSVSERLHKPLTKYLKQCLSISGFADTLWIDKTIVQKTYEKDKESLTKYYPTNINAATIKVPFGTLYLSTHDLERTFENLVLSEKTLKFINIADIKKAEDELYNTLTLYIERFKENPEVRSDNKNNLKRLIGVVESVLQETELLALSIYQYNTLYNSVNETIITLDKAI